MAVTDSIFGEMDTNHNGSLSIKEVRAALEEHTAYDKYAIHEICYLAEKDAGADKVLDKKEFNKLANQVQKKSCWTAFWIK